MTNEDTPSSADLGGCLMALWQLIVTSPIWFVLLYTVMDSIDGLPDRAWILFWIYVPCCILGIILTAIAKQVWAKS